MTSLRAFLRRWLGIDSDRRAIDADLIRLALHVSATATVADQCAADRIEDHRLVTESATTLNRLASIVRAQNTIIARWARESETLRHIEARHKRQAEGSKILTLDSIAKN